MKIFSYRISFFIILAFIANISGISAKTPEEKSYKNIQALSFSSISEESKSLNEEEYLEFIKEHIFNQPEFQFASAMQNEKRFLLKSANRERFPSISGRIINDEVIDRKIDDFNSLRKRQDDSFDAVAEINQTLYSGGKISSQIRYARHEASNSIIERNSTTSKLILDANSVFISAMIYDYIYTFAISLVNELLPLKEKMEKRAKSGAIDPAQYALFLARFNKFQSTVYSLEAKAQTSRTNFENIFNKSYSFVGFPRLPIIINGNIELKESFNLAIKENVYLSSLENVNITKSDYRPQLGLRARYTEYDIDDSRDESDIRGGLYFNLPIFDFGRGRAKIQASQAKAYAAKIDIDIAKKTDKITENEILAILESSNKAIDKLKEAYKDTKTQRKIISERILLTGFSPTSLIETSENELAQLQILLETEFTMLTKFYELLHHNQSLINHFKLVM